MIPLYRTSNMEAAVNLMAANFRQVVVDANYSFEKPVRFRPDLIVGTQVYFSKVQSQITRWQNGGGVLIRWKRDMIVGPHEALLYAECPRSTEILDRHLRETRWLCVVYEPPSWRALFETIQKRNEKKPKKLIAHREALERIQQLLGYCNQLTPSSLARLLHAHPGEIAPPWSAPVLREGEGRSSDTSPGVL